MDETDIRKTPDQHLDPTVAANYDESLAGRFVPEVIEPAVDLLTDLADGGKVVEFAVGTGRIAIPLAGRGVAVSGMDISGPMLDELRKKPGAEIIETVVGDMTTTRMCADAALVYLVFNTIGNLRTQALQVACFRNAAAHLRPGGRFVIETNVPQLHRLAPGERIRPFDVSPTHLGFDEHADPVNQVSISHHYFIDGDRVRTLSGVFRYVWPSELDLMAQLAGLTLEDRFAAWDRSVFTGNSPSHVSIWRKS